MPFKARTEQQQRPQPQLPLELAQVGQVLTQVS
jgi:hypothetical protein